MTTEEAIATGVRYSQGRLRPLRWRIAEPTVLPVPYGEMVDQLRIGDHDEQATVERLTLAASTYITKATHRAATTATVSAIYPRFSLWMLMPVSPFGAVMSFQYRYDGAGDALPPLDTSPVGSVYRVIDDEPPMIERLTDSEWPTDLDTGTAAPVELTYTAGVATADLVSTEHRVAIAMLAAHWYDIGREPVVEQSVSEMPLSLQAIIQSLRVEVRV